MMDVRKMASMGQQAMRKQQSAAEKVFWPLQAGRPRELNPGLLEAVHLGRQTANKLYSAMREAKLRMKDGACVLVCAKDGKLAGCPLFTSENEDAGDLEIVQKYIIRAKCDPIGVAFMLLDREKGRMLIHTRAFQRTEENIQTMSAVREKEQIDRIMSALDEKWTKDLREGKMVRYN
jgi:hypothetical protein